MIKTSPNYIGDGNGNLSLGTSIIADGSLSFYQGASNYVATIQPTNTFTADRLIHLPNESGTIALTSILDNTVFGA